MSKLGGTATRENPGHAAIGAGARADRRHAAAGAAVFGGILGTGGDFAVKNPGNRRNTGMGAWCRGGSCVLCDRSGRDLGGVEGVNAEPALQQTRHSVVRCPEC